MSSVDRKEAEVRRLLDTGYPLVPPSLADRSARRGRRLLRRRRITRYTFWFLSLAVLVALAVWAATSDGWVEPTNPTTPDFTDW
ncbi:hypothetical protein AB0M28_29400 [Streptomyces sp. NPDC051940]|uniref:hypothetical protein n=1 Tax=Streptomyces sp. NPDC051940 TaxID=3155675 RepID=UPI00343D9916